MIRNPQRSKLASGILAAALAAPGVSHAAFIEDSTARIDLRNFYLNRDFRNEGNVATKKDTAHEWGQGVTARFESGFTEGPVGFGLDAIAITGIKLDSSNSGEGGPTNLGVLIPAGKHNDQQDTFGEVGATAKMRVSKTVLKLGTLQPLLPVVAYNDVRMLQSTYTGGLLTSQEIAGLTINAGRLNHQNLRDSTNNDHMGVFSGSTLVESDHLDLLGGSYAVTPQLTASYYFAEMADIYKQNFAGLVHKLPLGAGLSLTTDLRYFDTKETGDEKMRSKARVDGGRIDNRFFNGMVTLGVGMHKFGVGYQNLSGDGDFAFPGLDPYSIDLVTYNIFTKAETDAWQLRYDYDFAALGVPGLTFMTRYVNADNVEAMRSGRQVTTGTEWERDTDLAYAFQSGALKGLNLRLRNATFRNGGGLAEGDVDEWRFVVNYTIPLF